MMLVIFQPLLVYISFNFVSLASWTCRLGYWRGVVFGVLKAAVRGNEG